MGETIHLKESGRPRGHFKRAYTVVEWLLIIGSIIAIIIVAGVFFKRSAMTKAKEIVKISKYQPGPVPWPANSAPLASPLMPPPEEADDLARFKGYDAIVITYTSEEATALATLFTPGYPTAHWYNYRHAVDAYVPLVTADRAPFNNTNQFMIRYYHSLGLYFPCTIGKAKVLLFKSNLHLDRDGPDIPLRKLVNEMIQAIQPKIFITTGAGGGIGRDVALGDVVIAGLTKFDCTGKFKDEAWHAASYKTTPVPPGALAEITPALTVVNAAKLQDDSARPVPKIWAAATDAIVTTDFFCYDDSQNTLGLQGLGRACDMDDAMIGQVMQDYPNIKWFAIRNVANPQIQISDADKKAAGNRANSIYSQYGIFTSVASSIATWAVIDNLINK
ncbi:MAG TPA: hypothetical protein VG347_23105 [Verrucomicrobiae bacterium]|nr:hypothetical protein [Verrucomicrobiae bacterium]